MYKYLIVFFSSLSILSCSTGEREDIQSTRTDYIQVNVAENTSATASYDSDNADLVTDGDSSTSNYWSGNIPGDNLTIDLGKANKITKIVVHTNETNISTIKPSVTYELSLDGTNWSETLLPSGGNIPCIYQFAAGSSKIICDVRPGIDGLVQNNSVEYRYFKITVNSANVGLIQFYEVEITGWVQKTTVI
jgi:hypothetical protein